MKDKEKFILIKLAYAFFKIGLFTFGGGYAMIPLIQKEVVENKKWLTNRDITDIISISESTPGPIAINAATYIGYKKAGFWGSLFATIGVVLPSFIIISLLALVYEQAMQWSVMIAAFRGIHVATIILLTMAIIKLSKTVDKTKTSLIIFMITLIGMLLLNFFVVHIPFITLAFIVFGATLSIIVFEVTEKGETK